MMRTISLFVMLAGSSGFVRSQSLPKLLNGVGIQQKMGAQLPLDLPFTDETGQSVTLRQYLGKPTILALVYYQCPSLCNLVLSGIVKATNQLSFKAARDFNVIAISFDPRENFMLARDKKAAYAKELKEPGAEHGWHFLTGEEPSSRGIADAAGFHFRYDPASNQYVHASAILLLTPQGRISRYFYGIDYPARDVKLGLIDASGSKIGSPIDRVQLFCFHYDPTSGKYGFAIMNALRIGGLVTLAALGIVLTMMLRRQGEAHG